MSEMKEMSEDEKREHRERLSKAATEMLEMLIEQQKKLQARAEEMKSLQEAWEKEDTTQQTTCIFRANVNADSGAAPE